MPPVGCTISEAGGRRPVEAPFVGSASSEERRPPTRPADDEGSTISDAGGMPPVETTDGSEVADCDGACDEPGTMKGPWKLVAEDGVASDEGAAEGVPEMITSGSLPVEAACWGVVEGATDG